MKPNDLPVAALISRKLTLGTLLYTVLTSFRKFSRSLPVSRFFGGILGRSSSFLAVMCENPQDAEVSVLFRPMEIWVTYVGEPLPSRPSSQPRWMRFSVFFAPVKWMRVSTPSRTMST